MRKITTKADADEFYKVINSHIDEYVKKNKVNPINLRKYFAKKDKVDNFLNRIGLNDVEKIKTILNDVLEDREAMVKDKVLKFERFLIKEGISLSAVNIEYEKVLADCFHTSLSHIEVKDEKNHEYQVDDIGDKLKVAIFSEKDIESFKEQLKEVLIKEAKGNSLEIYKLDVGLNSKKELKTKFSVSLENMLDEKKLSDSINDFLTNSKTLEIMNEWLNDYPVLQTGKKWKFHKKFKGHFIWKLENKKSH